MYYLNRSLVAAAMAGCNPIPHTLLRFALDSRENRYFLTVPRKFL